jgi:hypothetical protein
MNMRIRPFLITVLGLAMASHAMARDLTAFELVKAGDPYVGVQSKDKVLQIRSEKSIASLTPDMWHVVYYDPTIGMKSMEVTFGGGKELQVSHPSHPFQMPFHDRDILDNSKLKIDSDDVLKKATSQPLLKNLTLKASQLTLDHSDLGPVWKIRLWAAKLNNPDKQVDIGMITFSATDGSIVKSDLRPDRVD